MNATGESDLINYVEFLQGLQKDIYVPRLKIVDFLLAKHFDIPEFDYEFNCIFPESALQKQERFGIQVDWMVKLADSGIVSRESALDELKAQGIVSQNAKVGEAPNNINTGNKNEV